jgi:hypothetical protein
MKGKAMSSAIKAEIMAQQDTIANQQEEIMGLQDQVDDLKAPAEPTPKPSPSMDPDEESMPV